MAKYILVHYDDNIAEVVPIGFVRNKQPEEVKKHGQYKIAWCADIDLKNQVPPDGVTYYKAVVLQLFGEFCVSFALLNVVARLIVVNNPRRLFPCTFSCLPYSSKLVLSVIDYCLLMDIIDAP